MLTTRMREILLPAILTSFHVQTSMLLDVKDCSVVLDATDSGLPTLFVSTPQLPIRLRIEKFDTYTVVGGIHLSIDKGIQTYVGTICLDRLDYHDLEVYVNSELYRQDLETAKGLLLSDVVGTYDRDREAA